MPGTSPILGLPMANQDSDFVTDFPDAVDIPRTTGLEKYTVPRFNNITDRNTKIPTPAEGQLCYLKDTGTLQMHNGYVWVGDTAWVPLTLINGWLPQASGQEPYIRMGHTGRVEIRGNIKGTSATNSRCFVVPANYQPSGDTWYMHTFAQGAAYMICAAYIDGAGACEIYQSTGALSALLHVYTAFNYSASFKAVR